MPTYPDCSYVSVDDVNEPTGASYIYCLAAEVRELKQGAAELATIESEFIAGIVAPYYWADTVLAMHMDGPDTSTDFIDEKEHTVTVAGSAVISTARSKFGGASALFDHTGNCLVPYSTDFNIGINDFTIKGWCYRTTSGADRVFFSLIDNNADSWNNRLFIGKTTEERLRLVVYTAAGTQIAITNPTPMPSGQWVHFLACRISGTYYLAEDGVFVASSTPALITHDNSGVCIGNSYPGSLGWQGNVDDLEFIIHRTTLPQPAIDFTPPTTAFKHP
jgi:hypothetical protein